MSEIADDPEELDAMIGEMGCPWDVHPEYAQPGEVPTYLLGFNRGCARDGVTLYREAQEWRERVLAELERQRGWVASWHAERALNDRIAELCRERGFTFMSWETAPWDAPDELPADYKVLNDTLPAAVRLRRRLVAEIESKQVPSRWKA